MSRDKKLKFLCQFLHVYVYSYIHTGKLLKNVIGIILLVLFYDYVKSLGHVELRREEVIYNQLLVILTLV